MSMTVKRDYQHLFLLCIPHTLRMGNRPNRQKITSHPKQKYPDQPAILKATT